MQKVLARVLQAIKPSGGELSAELAFAELMVAHIRDNAPKGCDVVLTGSMAKRTFLRDKRDIDIFVLFGRSVPRESLEPFIKDIMAASFPSLGYQLSYAEHPYSRFHFEGRRIDLVPAYKITKAAERISAVDRSVLHTKFVTGSLKKKQVDDVLLLKQFLRSSEIYGAEIKIGGFSGYLCELLIIKYGGFPALLKASAKWKAGAAGGIFIDIKKYYKPSEAGGASKRFGSQFVVIDPTDRNRNVAAAVSGENLRLFISLARRFIKKPAESFFFRKPLSFEEKAAKASKGKKLYVLSMPRPDIVDDILWGQLHKMLGQLESHLGEFQPKGIIADDSRHLVRLAIILGRDRLPDKMLVAGPPLEMKKHAAQFRKSHKRGRFIIKKKRLYAEVKRPLAKADEAIHSFFRAFATTKSHLAYPEEMLVLEKK
ncbi:CCA tRNA nucleotidyltransferase [Candidatus Micrarchaeota archaeon]|nr:CCA tRNA nucleotidyltransferase [Candidatus Micrarchaeota archaeon]